MQDPLAGLNGTLEFLGLPPVASASLEARNTRTLSADEAETTSGALREYFAPHNRRLEALLGRAMGW